MTEALEDVLIEMTNQIMKLEDDTEDYSELLEAKKLFLIGIVSQVDLELQLLNKEYDNLGLSLADELEELARFDAAREAYNGIMSSLFKH